MATRRAAILSPIARMAAGGGPMKVSPASSAGLGEARVLGEEAVARMHRVGSRGAGGGDELVDDEIALAGRRRADRHRLVREQHVEGLAVGLGEDGDGRDAELAARPDDADGDLAAIRDEDLANGALTSRA